MTARDFIFNMAPYKKITGEDFAELYKELSHDNLSVDGYNPLFGVDTTYHLESLAINVGRGPYPPSELEPCDDNIRVMSFRCGRTSSIMTLVVYCNKEERYIMKIGTYPSLRDFHKDDIKKFDKVLNEQQKMELVTAIMISSNGVGIGSYVYLRRIFEGIVFEEAERAINDGVIDRAEFVKMRMDEKIVAIKDYLPVTGGQVPRHGSSSRHLVHVS